MHRLHLLVLALAGLVVSAGCRSHVPLRAPDPSASLEQRVDAYADLQIAGQMDVITLQRGVPVSRTADFLVLANGSRIYFPEDLLAVVAADSPTARAARRSVSARHKKWWWYGGGVAATIGGLSLMAYDEGQRPDGTYEYGPAGSAGAALALVGVLGGLFGFFYYNKQTNDEKVTAFTTYDRSLRRALDLCVDELRLVDCSDAGL